MTPPERASGLSRPWKNNLYLHRDDSRNGHRIVGHEGGFPGINSQLDIYLDLGYTVAVMSNYDPPADRVANQMRDMFTQE